MGHKKKQIIFQLAKCFKNVNKNTSWIEDLFHKTSQEWLYLNICLFVFISNGYYSPLSDIKFIKRAYSTDQAKTLSYLTEVLGYYISDNGYCSLLSCNLITALSELQVNEPIVKELLETIYQIVNNRLPFKSNEDLKIDLYRGLDDFCMDETVVALLIARLMTLTSEKTQGIIWSLIYIAQTNPTALLRPYQWAFLHNDSFLPIHRSLLLQILKENVSNTELPDALINILRNTYPTGFFLEDQYIRSFVGYELDLIEDSSQNVLFPPHRNDTGFVVSINYKYSQLASHLGYLSGTYNAYIYKRDKINERYSAYYDSINSIFTPIIPHSNALYTIINNQYYPQLKQLTKRYRPEYICNLRFLLEEISVQIGSLTKRPSILPTPIQFPSDVIQNISKAYVDDNWVVIASQEDEIFGEEYKPKKTIRSTLTLTLSSNISLQKPVFSKFSFRTRHYTNTATVNAEYDNPISLLSVIDNLEKLNLVYISPYLFKEFKLGLSGPLYCGFPACDSDGNIISRLITWKEQYYRDIEDGIEIPRLTGVGVIIRKDYFEKIQDIYQQECLFVIKKYEV